MLESLLPLLLVAGVAVLIEMRCCCALVFLVVVVLMMVLVVGVCCRCCRWCLLRDVVRCRVCVVVCAIRVVVCRCVLALAPSFGNVVGLVVCVFGYLCVVAGLFVLLVCAVVRFLVAIAIAIAVAGGYCCCCSIVGLCYCGWL